MSSDRFLSLLVIFTLLLPLTVSEATPSTVWVAPTEGECQEKSPCGTLQDLWLSKPGVNVISESNTTWVFLPGVHKLNPTGGGLILFWQVANVVLSGSESCVRKKEACTLVCANYLCFFLFIGSRNVTIQHLNIVYGNSSYLHLPHFNQGIPYNSSQFCQQIRLDSGNVSGVCSEWSFNLSATSWMFLWSANVRLYSLHLIGYSSQITVYNPSERFEVVESCFSQLPPASNEKFPNPNLSLLILPSTMEAKSVHVLVSECTYEAQSYFPSIKPNSVMNYYNHHAVLVQMAENRSELEMMSLSTIMTVNVTIDSCKFLRTSGVHIQLTDSPVLLATIQIVNSLFNGMVARRIFRAWGFMHLEGSGVKIQLLTGLWGTTRLLNASSHQTMLSRILVSRNAFQNLASIEGIGVSLRSVYIGRQDLCICKVPVVIENNKFWRNWGLQYASIIDATHTWPNGSSVFSDCGHRPFIDPAVDLRNNSFSFNTAEFSKCLQINISQQGPGVFVRRWNVDQQCTVGDPGKGIVYMNGFRGTHFISLANSSISMNTATGLSVIDSQVLLKGCNTLRRNYGPYGGGVFLAGRSQMLLMNGTKLFVLQNAVAFTGGGIFVSPMKSQLTSTLGKLVPHEACFFDVVTANGSLARNITSSADLDVNVTLSDNQAYNSGSSVFLSSMTPCVHQGILQDETEVFSKLFHLPSYSDKREISSLPLKICSCNSSGPISCSLSSTPPLQVFLGQQLDLWFMLVGEMNIILSGDLSMLISMFSLPSLAKMTKIEIPMLSLTVKLFGSCTKITITRESVARLATGEYYIILYYPILEGTPFVSSKLNLVTYLNMTLLDHCPHGYSMIDRGSGPLCECHSALQDRHITCSLDTLSFVVPPWHWIGVGSTNTSLLISDNCLPAYCRDVYMSKEVFLSNLTQQCLHGRVGTLCGECPEGQSVMLGSYNCMACSYYGLLVVALFLIAGPFVIALICFLNWTVTARSSNGLLLYLNVVSINSDLLLSTNSFAFAVISWLNLEMGIEMCLFDGMDEFAKTAVGFAFPLYLLSLVALIVMVSKCINMHRINKLIGPRITPVLATVIFLSYTMLSDSVLKSLLFASLCNTDGGCQPVWLLDGSLKYFRSIKHLILACIALTVLFVLLIPITLIAVIGDLFRRCISNRWYMNFLDTFHSSYRFRWGFWMGVRLMLRVVLLLLKVTVKPEVVWLVTACLSLSLAAAESVLKPFRHLRFDRFTHRLVERWCSSDENGRTVANYLDISFLVNLTALFLCISYLPDSAEVFISLSLCVALLELLLILTYHLVEYSPLWPPLLRAATRMAERVRVFVQSMRSSEEQLLGEEDTNHVLLNLPLVLRADDCQDEDYDDSVETSDEEVVV